MHGACGCWCVCGGGGGGEYAGEWVGCGGEGSMCVGGLVVVVECEYGHRGVLIQLVACRLVDHCAKPCDMCHRSVVEN